MLMGPLSSGAAVGSNGSATAHATYPIAHGFVEAIQVHYSVAAANCTVVVKTGGQNAPSVPLLTKATSKTDATYYPRVQACSPADGSAITGEYGEIPIEDTIDVAISGANAGDYVQVYIYLLRHLLEA